jgi:sugar phosphate isomerase/epimerase
MKLGVISTAISHLAFEEGLQHLERLGLQSIEVGVGGLIPKNCGDPDELLKDSTKLHRWRESFQRYGLEISALALHGLPLSPDRQLAHRYSQEFGQACELASAVGVPRLTLLAGLPEGVPGDTAPCWIIGPFEHVPTLQSILEWQWEQRVIPYWREHAKIAEDLGIKLCFEMHPYDVVFNPESLLRLREAVGDVVVANFDPSLLFWQGIDPLAALRFLGDVVQHVHAKDARIYADRVRLNGILDVKPFSSIRERSWSFRTVGYGHGELFWREFVSTLHEINYEGHISIEHEDEYVDLDDGLRRAVSFLRPIMPHGTSGRV